MLISKIPEALMKPVGTADGGFELLLRENPEAPITPIAKIYPGPQAALHAKVLSAAFLMLHLVDAMVENIQPENWDETTDQGQIWHRAFSTLELINP